MTTEHTDLHGVADIATASKVIEAVLALHVPDSDVEGACGSCYEPIPCPTIRAMSAAAVPGTHQSIPDVVFKVHIGEMGITEPQAGEWTIVGDDMAYCVARATFHIPNGYTITGWEYWVDGAGWSGILRDGCPRIESDGPDGAWDIELAITGTNELVRRTMNKS